MFLIKSALLWPMHKWVIKSQRAKNILLWYCHKPQSTPPLQCNPSETAGWARPLLDEPLGRNKPLIFPQKQRAAAAQGQLLYIILVAASRFISIEKNQSTNRQSVHLNTFKDVIFVGFFFYQSLKTQNVNTKDKICPILGNTNSML